MAGVVSRVVLQASDVPSSFQAIGVAEAVIVVVWVDEGLDFLWRRTPSCQANEGQDQGHNNSPHDVSDMPAN